MGRSPVHSLAYIGYLLVAFVGVVAIFWLSPQRTRAGSPAPYRSMPIWAAVLLALAVALFESVSLKFSSPPGVFWDFLNAYYPAGRAALDHDPAALKALIGTGAEGGFVNIPVVAYLFAPFGCLPPQIAAAVFTALGVGSAVAAWFLLVRLAQLERRERFLLALLFLVNGPLLNGVKFGNISYFLVFALTAGLTLLRARRSTAAGLLLGAAAVLKPPLALFGLFFLLRRDLRGVLGFAFFGAATVALSLLLFGWTTNLFWFQNSVLQYSHNWLAGSSVQSIPAFLARLHGPPAILFDWSAKAPTAANKVLAQGLNGLLFLIAVCACVRFRPQAAKEDGVTESRRRDLQYLLMICLCLVCSPLSWTHYYSWLLIPAAFFLGAPPVLLASTTARVVGWAAIALVTPLVLWPQSTTPSTLTAAYVSFFVSHYLFGGLLWFGLIAWWLARTGGVLSQARPIGTPRTIQAAR
jgi:alpha-1,2-mannosyltransferase